MSKKILIVSPEIPDGSGGGRYFWQLAEAGSKYSDWETHLLSPMFKKDVDRAKCLDGFRKTTGRKLKLYEKEKAEQLLEEAIEYNKKEDFDILYLCSEIEIKEKAHLLENFKCVVVGVHDHVNFLDNYDNTKPITEQFGDIKRSKALEDLLSYSDKVDLWHVISELENKIWSILAPEQAHKTVLLRNMAKNIGRYGIPWDERSDEIMFAGRIQTHAKGLKMVRSMLDKHPERKFRITVPYGSIAKATKYYGNYDNCRVNYLTNHEDVLKEMGKHKVFCNPGTYGPFDLTTFEASAQGCQIVLDSCIGSSDYISEKVVPKEHTTEGFMEAIDIAMGQGISLNNDFLGLEENIELFFNTLKNECDRRRL